MSKITSKNIGCGIGVLFIFYWITRVVLVVIIKFMEEWGLTYRIEDIYQWTNRPTDVVVTIYNWLVIPQTIIQNLYTYKPWTTVTVIIFIVLVVIGMFYTEDKDKDK